MEAKLSRQVLGLQTSFLSKGPSPRTPPETTPVHPFMPCGGHGGTHRSRSPRSQLMKGLILPQGSPEAAGPLTTCSSQAGPAGRASPLPLSVTSLFCACSLGLHLLAGVTGHR